MAEGGRSRETRLGGDARDFPVTSWSLIAGMKDSSTGTSRQALESLCTRYWKPVYHYVRRAWSKSSEDAKDLTQAFFMQILEGDALHRYAPERGGFRTYLKVLLRGFAADQHDAMTALKRGGGAKLLTLDAEEAPLRDLLPDAQATTPEQLFDRSWKKEVLERAVERTRQWFVSAGRERQFKAFEAYDLKEGRTYAEVAESLGMSESDVRNHLFAVRERLRAEIRAELSQTVAAPGELEDEWRALFEE
jgi:RNA polymerase sigma-70 factor (ECF subfamily)